MYQKTKTALAIVGVVTLIAVFWSLVISPHLHLSFALDYKKLTQRSSPDDKMTAHSFQSQNDGVGHAPYGKVISLSSSKDLSSPERGYVVFAGYCSGEPEYEWSGNQKLVIRCQSTDPARTLASVAFGIDIVFENIPKL